MPVLSIRHRSGTVETRELSKRMPLLVGRLATNDIRADGDDVSPVHCRISWNRNNFEVAAATPGGVEWNGATVQQALLSPGDIIRVGHVEIELLESADGSASSDSGGPGQRGPSKPVASGMESGGYELKPMSRDELPVRSFHYSADMTSEPAPTGPKAAADLPTTGSRKPGMSRVPEVAVPESRSLELILDEPDSEKDGPDQDDQLVLTRSGTAGRSRPKPAPPVRMRPGEQDVLRSPLVLGLGIGTLLLLLTAATIWFVLNRESAQREYDAARKLMDGGQFQQAIEAFEQFLRDHPRHGQADEAELAIATARVEQPLAGAVPAWDAGVEALQGFIDRYRESKAFQDVKSPVRSYVIQTADRIAMGAVESARTMRKRPFLTVSAQAAKLLELYSPSDSPPTERLQEIAAATRTAEAAILQQERFDAVARRMDESLQAGQPLAALPEYRRVLDRYPNAAEYRPLGDRVRKALDLERSAAKRDETRREAIRTDRPQPVAAPLTLARRARTRTDVSSVGATVVVVAEDSVFGIDSATGEPLWRRVVGLDLPFNPLSVSAGVPATLLYDTRYRDLVLVQQRTGELLWRLALDARPQGAPLIREGQLWIATAGGVVEQIDVHTGASASRVILSQELVGPPVVSLSGERLYVPGHADVLYVLTRRPLGCEQAAWLGHGPGAIAASPVMMRSYLLIAENDRTDQSRLRVFDATREDQPPRQIAESRVAGLVHDDFAVRGKELVVPSSAERISAFTVAETGDQQSLTFIASYQVKDAHGGPMFVALGPDDQLWMASSALRRFTVSRESLLPDKQELAVGVASQPLQFVGDALYVGRRTTYDRAVLFGEVDRVRMTAQWQTSLGAHVLECTAPSADGGVLCVTSLGDLIQMSGQRVARGGFEMQSLAQVPVPEGLAESLAATRLSDGRLAVWCGGEQSRLWIIGSDGIVRESKLSHPPQSDPIALGPGILLPLPGRLRLLGRGGDASIAEDLPAPVVDAASADWRSVASLDETQALALDGRGRLSRIQYRTSPVPHLTEITHWDAGSPVDQKLAVTRGRALLVDANGRLVMLDASTLEPLAESNLGGPASRAPWATQEQALVEVAGAKLVCCDLSQRLARMWELSLDGVPLVGAPLAWGGNLLIALADGRLLAVDPATGKVSRTLDLEQRLAFGPQLWGEHVVVGTLDGSLMTVNAHLQKSN